MVDTTLDAERIDWPALLGSAVLAVAPAAGVYFVLGVLVLYAPGTPFVVALAGLTAVTWVAITTFLYTEPDAWTRVSATLTCLSIELFVFPRTMFLATFAPVPGVPTGQTLLGVTLVLWIGGGIVYAATARLAWNSVHSVPARVWKA